MYTFIKYYWIILTYQSTAIDLYIYIFNYSFPIMYTETNYITIYLLTINELELSLAIFRYSPFNRHNDLIITVGIYLISINQNHEFNHYIHQLL